MENVQLIGEVTLELRDIDAVGNVGPVVQSWKQENVVTDKAWRAIASQASLGPYIALTSDTTPTSAQNPHIGALQCYATGSGTAGYVAIGMTSPQWFEVSGPDPMYCQFVARWDPPVSVSRTINAVFLSNQTLTENQFAAQPRYNAIVLGGYYKSTHVLLNSPCTQTTLQVLDVYYRLKWLYPATTTGFSNYSLRKLARLACNVGGETGINNAFVCWNANLGVAGTTFNTFQNYSTGKDSLTPTMSNVSSRYLRKGSWSMTAAAYNGAILGSQMHGNTLNFGIYSWDKLRSNTASPIQPIHNHTAGSGTPFLDASFLATGTGYPVASGTWTDPDWPKLFRINITASGAIGVATYKFTVRKTMGFDGPNYAALYQPDAGWIPWIPDSSTNCMTNGTTTHGMLISNPADNASYNGIKYNSTAIVTHDTVGISYASLIAADVRNFDSTTTPALTVSAITQIAVGADGRVWVGCSATGLHWVNPVANTSGNITIPGVTNQYCYGVDIGRSGSIWAVMDGGLCHSTDNGVNWTVYNSGSSPAFTQVGVTDSNWSTVAYMRADPAHVDDRVALIRKQGTAVNQPMAIVWWSIAAPAAAALIATSGAYGQVQYVNGFGDFRDDKTKFDVSDNDGFWAGTMRKETSNGSGSNAGITYRFTFGSTAITTAYGQDNTVSIYNRGTGINLTATYRVFFERTSAGADALMVLDMGASYYPRISLCPGGGVAPTTITPYGSGGTAPARGNGLHGNTNCPTIYLGGGMWFYIKNPGTYGSLAQLVPVVVELAHDSTGAGALAYITEDSYGWNGSAWVLNHSGSKTTHTGQQALVEGITIGFTEPGTGTSFVNTEYYTFGVCNGLMKDNATTAQGSFNTFPVKTVTSSDFDSGGVVANLAAYSGSTAITWANAPGSGFSVSGTNTTLSVADTTADGFSLMSNELLTGDFVVQWVGDYPNVWNTGLMGLGDQFGNPMWGIYSDASTGSGQQGNASFSAGGLAEWTTDYAYPSTNTSISTARNTITVWKLSKVGNDLLYYQNTGSGDVLKRTVTGAFTDLNIQLRVVHWWPTGVTGRYPIPTILTNTVFKGVNVGISANSTGKYDTNFYLFNDSVSSMTFSLNGTAVSTIYADGNTAPGVNEVSLNSSMRAIICNTADTGKTLTGTYIYTKLPNT